MGGWVTLFCSLSLPLKLEGGTLCPWAPENSTTLPFRRLEVTCTSPGKLAERQLHASHHSHCQRGRVQGRPSAFLCLSALCQAQGLQSASLRLGTTLGTESTAKMQCLWQTEEGV